MMNTVDPGTVPRLTRSVPPPLGVNETTTPARSRSFREVGDPLRPTGSKVRPKTAEPALQRLREIAGRVTGSVFFGTLLKTMRQSSLKGRYGHGGRGEEVFAAQLHDLLADRLGAAFHGGPGEMLYQRLARQQRLMAAHGDRWSQSTGQDENAASPRTRETR